MEREKELQKKENWRKKKTGEKQWKVGEILGGFNKLRENEHDGKESVGRITHLNDETMLHVWYVEAREWMNVDENEIDWEKEKVVWKVKLKTRGHI